jgi:hypothetical protein
MRVYQHVLDAGPQTVELLEAILGCGLEETFEIYSGRRVSGLKPDSGGNTLRGATAAMPCATVLRLCRAQSKEAADGIRTQDLLHGKQDIWFWFGADIPCKCAGSRV